MTVEVDLWMPPAYRALFRPYRYKLYYGGRAAARSWSFAKALVTVAASPPPDPENPYRIGCFRQYQNSIKESVHANLAYQIRSSGLAPYFHIGRDNIRSIYGNEFIYGGLHQAMTDPTVLKSIEGLSHLWIEEGQRATKDALQLIRPTLRRPGSELWISMNTGDADDPVYQELIEKTPPRMYRRKVTWRDNQFFLTLPELELERSYMQENDPEAYRHVWDGDVRKFSSAVIFRDKVEVRPFTTPEGVRFYQGADWGFADDPTTLLRCYIEDETLFVDREVWLRGCELEDIPKKFDALETSRTWPILADSARPEVISFVKRAGFNIAGAEKWPGSVEDGIAHLRGFKKIIIHPRCTHLVEESRLYRYKVDRITEEVIPLIIDKHNHGWDALRYALGKFIKNRGRDNQWARLAS